MSIFIRQTMAEYKAMGLSPGDENFLRGFEANILRVASDFFWADYISGFLTETGLLIEAEEWRLQTDLRDMITAKIVTIPETIVKPLMNFMTYTLLSVIHLNEFVAGKRGSIPAHSSHDMANNKRKRIVGRLSLGLTAAKRRRFTLSKLSQALGDIPKATIESQIRILESHAVVTCPTRRSVQLNRILSHDVQTYLLAHCGYTQVELVTLMNNSEQLRD